MRYLYANGCKANKNKMSNVPPPPLPINAFLLTPATSYANVPIHLNSRESQGIYKRVTSPFPDEFNGEPSNVLAFVSNLGERVAATRWNLTTISMLNTTISVTGIVQAVDLATEHGTVNTMQLRNNIMAYINNVSQVSQNTYHMYKTLMVYISKEFRQQIMVDIDQAWINGIGNGPMIFKLIMLECTIDTPSTVIRLREKMLVLDTYMITV